MKPTFVCIILDVNQAGQFILIVLGVVAVITVMVVVAIFLSIGLLIFFYQKQKRLAVHGEKVYSHRNMKFPVIMSKTCINILGGRTLKPFVISGKFPMKVFIVLVIWVKEDLERFMKQLLKDLPLLFLICTSRKENTIILLL